MKLGWTALYIRPAVGRGSVFRSKKSGAKACGASFCIIGILALGVSLALAQEKGPSRDEAQDEFIAEYEEDAFESDVDAYIRYMPAQTVKAQPGRVEVVKSEAEYSYTFKKGRALPFKLGFGTRYVGFHQTDPITTEIPAHLTGVNMDLETTVPFFKLRGTYFRLGVTPTFNSSDWKFYQAGFRIPIRAYWIYVHNDKLIFVLGLGGTPSAPTPIYPIAGVIYSPNDRLTFNLIPDRTSITYDINKYITIFSEAEINNTEYIVKYEDLKNTSLVYSESHAGGGIKINFNKNISSTFSAGSVFKHALQYRDSLGKVGIKNNYYCEFRTEAAF